MKAVKAKWLVCSHSAALENHGMLYKDGYIVDILSNEKIDALMQSQKTMELLGGNDAIVLPGFINAHMHQYGILSHGIPCKAHFTDFEGFLKAYWWPCIEDRITGAEVAATTLCSAVEMLRSGITGFCDTLEAPFIEDETLCRQADLIEKIGMRGIVSLESSQRVNDVNGRRCLEENRNAVRYARKNLKLVRAAISTHTTFTCSPEFIRQAAEIARAEEAILQFHLSESGYEPSLAPRPTGIYRDNGALGKHVIASQCVAIDGQEIEWLQESGTKVVHMPLSNCEVGGGFAPVPQMLERGIEVALGSDGYINDFFTVMKGTFLLHKANHKKTDVMPAKQVFRMATEYGAKSLGFERCGLLEKGYCADFLVLQDSYPSPVTRENIYDQIVVYGEKERVLDVVIAGQNLLHNGKLLTIDEKNVIADTRAVTAEFWEKM